MRNHLKSRKMWAKMFRKKVKEVQVQELEDSNGSTTILKNDR